ncbi:beta-propeller fold lactonase family protein [Exilibacterium tricleocarpae]|uniref:Beta-propeller fold lactonase family protein n=1 Tax=Exilibacterium tricleocarpae TaxID=2591008 RepID=A0A545U9N3_9GAMM|nr:beta-propeller fold lactonase family protein [Exilibacterium tricleocarpae]TQV86182.1 beta-propeller fold lactonase family protein [Exilibacterium tricleocarpae]
MKQRLAVVAGAISLALLIVCGIEVFNQASYGRGGKESTANVQGPAKEIAFVSNAVDGTVTLIDIAGQQQVGLIDIKPDGAQVGFLRDPLQWLGQAIIERRGGLNYAQDSDLSRDGQVLFVSRGFLADVAAFDIATGEVLWRTPIAGFRADHMTIAPDGRRLYVSATIYGGNSVEVLDTTTGDKLGSFVAGQWPHDVHTTQDGKHIYTASLGNMQKPLRERGLDEDAYTVTVVDSQSLTTVRRYAFEAGVRPFQVTGNEATLYAQLSNTHSLIAHDLLTDSRIARLDLPVAAGVSETDWDFEAPHHGLALSPDEATLCVAGRASDYAGLVTTTDMRVAALVEVGNAPSWSVFDSSGEVCLLANTRSDDVSLVSIREQRELARIAAGRAPKHITVGWVPESVLASTSEGRLEWHCLKQKCAN